MDGVAGSVPSGENERKGIDMKERPILFNGEMVRAVMDGAKTQTRRIIKDVLETYLFVGMADNRAIFSDPDSPVVAEWKCPYGVAGDRLWVRETFRFVTDPKLWTCIEYRADMARIKPTGWNDKQGWQAEIEGGEEFNEPGPWRPSIFCPRFGSRINVEVFDVRVERVQSIDEADAKAEGTHSLIHKDMDPGTGAHISNTLSYRWGFAELWDSINGKPRKDGTDISWAANPWVWVVEFKRV